MTPEARARAVYELVKADPFGDSPLKAISDALASERRAAYERAAEVALDYDGHFSVWGEDRNTKVAQATCAQASAAILSLIDKPKEPT